MKLLVASVTALLALSHPAAALEVEHPPPGPLPGKPVEGKFGGDVRDVREAISTGHGRYRTRLLIARGAADQLCLAAGAGRRPRFRFRCLAAWDHPPLIVRVGAGGGSRARMNWLSVVGLVRADTARVTVETDRFANRTVPLRGAAGFPWKAFALAPARTDRRGTDRRHAIRARDETGAVLQRVELSWAWRAPCEPRRRCSRAQRRGRWAETRDPNGEKEAPFIRRGGGARVKRIATDHPAVQQIVAGQPFSFDGVAVWTKCKGNAVIGGVAEIRLSRPVRFEGDVPAHGYRNGSEYLEGVWHLRIQHAIGFRIYVDLKRARVVGISPHDDTLDGREGGRPAMKIDYTLVQPLRPVGTDSGDCESKPGA